MEANGQSLDPGNTFGQYKVVRILGHGGMGQVYEVLHEVLQTRHALKLISPEILEHEEGLQYFRNEARVMAQLRHPGIVAVDDFGQTDEHYWLRSELISGIELNGETIVSLEEYLERRKSPAHEREIADFLTHTLESIGYAHAKGVIHCDLKPANILLNPKGTKIADFGIVRLIREDWLLAEAEPIVQMTVEHPTGNLNATESAIVGTYEFMSPEQRKGLRVDGRSDLYSLGLIAYRMLTGREIPSLKRASEIRKGIHGSWDRWLEKALEENPADRFLTARDMLTSLPRVRTPTWFKNTARTNPIFITSDEDGDDPMDSSEPKQHKSTPKLVLGVLALTGLITSGVWLISKLPEGNGTAQQPQEEQELQSVPLPHPTVIFQPPAPPSVTLPASEPPVPTIPEHVTPSPTPTPVTPSPIPTPTPVLPKPLPLGLKRGNPHVLKNLDIRLMWAPPGKFQMGSPDSEPHRFAHEDPQHGVALSKGFWIGKTEVTIDQWNLLLPDNPRLGVDRRLPAYSVSWAEAAQFCIKLNQQEGTLMPGYEIRLPTEAEWEYACRAGSTHAYFFGTNSQNLANHTWFGRNSNGVSHPVGVQSSNRFGLHDMHGNVREWCIDHYADQYAENVQIDPVGPEEGDRRVTRGGSWRLFEPYCRSAARKAERPSTQTPDLGFRIVLGPRLPNP